MADLPDFNAKLWSQNLSAVLDRNRDMAACRKLKQDIEQTLKKVADGILLFNEFNKKMEESQVRPSQPASWCCLQMHHLLFGGINRVCLPPTLSSMLFDMQHDSVSWLNATHIC